MSEPLRLSFRRNAQGSGVTRVERLSLHPTLKERLLTRLKKKLGCGGAVKDGIDSSSVRVIWGLSVTTSKMRILAPGHGSEPNRPLP